MKVVCKKGNYLKIVEGGRLQRFTPWEFEPNDSGFKFIPTAKTKREAIKKAEVFFKTNIEQ